MPADFGSPSDPPSPPRVAAVIDIGVTSIRMAVGEIRGDGEVRLLDHLVQPVDLGRDVFDNRRLSHDSIERGAKILRKFRRTLREYGVDDPSAVRVVATTAVREAINSLAFTDRVFIATGLTVETIDEAEVNRVTYVGVAPHLRTHPVLADAKNVVMEVGGGTTEMLVIRGGNVLHSNSYRLGSLRAVAMFDGTRVGPARRRAVLESHIRRTLKRIGADVRGDSSLQLVALGRDVRWAAGLLNGSWDGGGITAIDAVDLAQVAEDLVNLDAGAIVRRYGIGFHEAETLVPALMVYSMTASEFGLRQIHVADTNLRDGLLQDLALGGNWTAEFRHQIVRSAIALGRKFGFDEDHARNVAELSRSLFDQLRDVHQLDDRYEVLLYAAALLHEIGLAVNVRSNHKHALYLIRNSSLFGVSRDELLLIGLVVRYHRRSYPQPTHEGFASLSQDRRVIVAKLAALLRLAIALDDRRSGRVDDFTARVSGRTLTIHTEGVEDVTLEQVAMRDNAGLFRDVYGLSVVLRGDPTADSRRRVG